MKSLSLGLILLTLTGCGQALANRDLDSVKTKAGAFVVKATTIQNVYDSLGPWDSVVVDSTGHTESVVYNTSDGGKAMVTFTLYCDDNSQNCYPSNGYDPAFPSHMLFSGVSY
jgi:hypothetical protein